jgi:predicted dehydrogenase
MKPPPLRWGVIGTGVIASQFAEDLRSQHGVCVQAVLSRDEKRAREFGARVGVASEEFCTNDFAGFASAIDVVYIATPHTDHVDDALRCLRAGLHVLVEKPLALTAEGAAAVFAEASSRRLFAMEAMWTRFIPGLCAAKCHVAPRPSASHQHACSLSIRLFPLAAFVEASAAAQRGEIGRVQHIRIDHGFDGSSAPPRLTDPQLAGGAWWDLGSYSISCSHAMLGRPRGEASVVCAAVTEQHTTGVDATTEGELSFTDASGSASFRVSLADGAAKNTLVAIGSEGSIVIHAPFHHPSAFSVNGTRHVFPLRGHGLWYQAAEVERCIARGELQSPSCTWDESRRWASALEQVAAKAGIAAVGSIKRIKETPASYTDRSALRVAVLGAKGRIGSMHAATLKAIGVGTVVGVDVGDPLPEKGSIDAAVVSSWSSAHEQHVRHCALVCGVPVFCEKPLTDGWESSVALAKDLAQAGVIQCVQIGFQRRFDPPLVGAAAAKASLGAVRTLRIDSRDPQPPPPTYMAQMGSHFYDMTIHDFDEARWLLGEEPTSIKASLSPDKMRAHVELTCPSGAVATIVNDRCCSLGYDQRAEIFCDKGRCASDSLPADSNAFFLERYAEAYKASLDDFLSRVVQGGAVPRVGVYDGLYAALLARCADEAVKSGGSVNIPPLPDDVIVAQDQDGNN